MSQKKCCVYRGTVLPLLSWLPTTYGNRFGLAQPPFVFHFFLQSFCLLLFQLAPLPTHNFDRNIHIISHLHPHPLPPPYPQLSLHLSTTYTQSSLHVLSCRSVMSSCHVILSYHFTQTKYDSQWIIYM